MEDFGYSMLCLFTAYIVASIIGILHVVFYVYLCQKIQVEMDKHEAYGKVRAWHVLLYFVVFSLFAITYFDGLLMLPSFVQTLITGGIWLGVSIIVDFIFWVVCKYSRGVGFRESYIDGQPWLSLAYLAIFISPLVAYLLY